MENYLPVYKKTIAEKQEKNINVEVTLPEYLPNINKIVKVSVLPSIKVSENTENGVRAVGKAVFAVVYLSDFNNNLKSTVFSEDYSAEFTRHNEQGTTLDDAILDCTVYTAEEKAVATSPRKISASCKLILQTEERVAVRNEVLECEETEKIKKLVKNVNAMTIKDLGESPIHIEEKISLESGMPCIREIVFADCLLAKTSCIEENGEAKISGNIIFNCLYYSAIEGEEEFPEYISMSKEIPFTVNVPLSEATNNMSIRSKMCITGVSADAVQDSYGDSNIISLSVDAAAQIKGYTNSEFSVCRDVFGTEFPVSCKTTKIEYDRFEGNILENVNVSENVHMTLGGIVGLISQEAKVIPVSEEITEEGILLNARVYLKLVGVDEMGGIECANSSFMIKIPIIERKIAGFEKCDFETDITVSNCKCNIVNGEIKCELTLCVDISISHRNSLDAVVAIETDDENKYIRNNSEYIIYYPAKDDTVWSVSKQYRVSPEKLSELNDIKKDDAFDKKTLIIPR